MTITSTTEYYGVRLRVANSNSSQPDGDIIAKQLDLVTTFADNVTGETWSVRAQPIETDWIAEFGAAAGIMEVLPQVEQSKILAALGRDVAGTLAAALADAVNLPDADLLALDAAIQAEKTSRGL